MRMVDVAWGIAEASEETLAEVCDYCGRPVREGEPRTEVGQAVYHRDPNCYVRKLRAIDDH